MLSTAVPNLEENAMTEAARQRAYMEAGNSVCGIMRERNNTLPSSKDREFQAVKKCEVYRNNSVLVAFTCLGSSAGSSIRGSSIVNS